MSIPLLQAQGDCQLQLERGACLIALDKWNRPAQSPSHLGCSPVGEATLTVVCR